MKVAVFSLGCKVNQSEGDDLLTKFREAGFEQAGPGESADIYIINTCTVTNEADRKSRKLIYRAIEKKATNDAIVAVTGCYAELAADKLRGMPGVDVVVAQQDKAILFDKVVTRLRRHAPSLALNTARAKSSRQRAYLKVQDGCENRCAYCIVPDARGRLRSVPETDVLKTAEALVTGGTKEIVLTGINIGKYGRENYRAATKVDRLFGHAPNKNDASPLVDLINKLLMIPGLARIRLSSIEPEDVTADLISLLKTPKQTRAKVSKNCAYLCPHVHIPLQSGDEEILRLMGRRYSALQYRETVDAIRAVCPDVAITTDVIVGFPGETDAQFRNTFDFIETFGPARLHVFRYSRRPGTPAAEMPAQVREAVKAERSGVLRGLGEKLAKEYRRRFIGLELQVLVENERQGILTGTSENYLSVSFTGGPEGVGNIIKTKLAE